ncbi:5786_t:CDS:1, partial [Gigaspora margarita]
FNDESEAPTILCLRLSITIKNEKKKASTYLKDQPSREKGCKEKKRCLYVKSQSRPILQQKSN